MKTCTVCNLKKPFTEFVRHALRKDGHASNCKACEADRRKRQAAINIANQAIVRAGMTDKLCRGCNRTLSLDAFSKHASGKDGLQSKCKACHKAYHDRTRDRVLERSSAYYKANRETILARQAQFRAEHPDRFKATQRKHKQEKAEQVRERDKAWRGKNVAKLKMWASRHYFANKAMYRVRSARRRAKQGVATPKWADPLRMREFYFAADFLGMVTGVWHEVDHIVPINSEIVCGLHCEFNMRVVPRSENRSKQNRYWPDMPNDKFDRVMTCMMGSVAETGGRLHALLKDAA